MAVVIFGLSTWNSLSFQRATNEELDLVHERVVPMLVAARTADRFFERLTQAFERAVSSHDVTRLAEASAARRGMIGALDELVEDPSLAYEAARTRAALGTYYRLANDIAERLIAQEHGEAIVGDMQRLQAAHTELDRRSKQLVGTAVATFEGTMSTIREQHQASFQFDVVLHTLGALMLIGFAFLLLRNPLRSFSEFRSGFRKLAVGRFDYHFTPRSRDEFGELCDEGNVVADSLARLRREQEEAAEALQASVDELMEANRRLQEFVKIASHDLREPVRTAHTYASLVLEEHAHELSPEVQRDLQTVVRLCGRLHELMEDLLHATTVNRQLLDIRLVDLNEVWDQVCDSHRALLEPSKAILEVPRPLPKVACDATLVGEVFSNLLTNALKYARTERPRIEISYSDRGPEEHPRYVFRVRDNGIGIPERHLERVFQPFKRLHTRDAYGGGTGLGLSIVRDIIRRHHGKVWLDSQVGVGTTFSFTLEGEAHG